LVAEADGKDSALRCPHRRAQRQAMEKWDFGKKKSLTKTLKNSQALQPCPITNTY